MGRFGRSAVGERRILVAQLSGEARHHADKRWLPGETFDEAAAVRELRAITTDPDVLAEAAACYLAHSRGHGHEQPCADLLIAAGATREDVDRYVAKFRDRSGPGLLDTIVDQANRPGSS